MLRPKEFPYSTSLKWTGEKKGALSCEGRPDIQVACPPEYGGHENIWSPEDLFVASVEVCVMTTFLWLAGREGMTPSSYESDASAIATMADGVFGIPKVTVRVRVGVEKEEDRGVAKKALGGVMDWCLVTKSIRPEVVIEPVTTVG